MSQQNLSMLMTLVSLRQMCLTMKIDILSIVKHICRKGMIDERALTNRAPLPNQSDCGGRLEARPISQPRCQRTAAEGIRLFSDLEPLRAAFSYRNSTISLEGGAGRH